MCSPCPISAGADTCSATMPTPPILYLTATGKLLAQASNYAAPDKQLEVMVKLLDDHPEYAELTESEEKLEDPVAKAWVHYDLRQLDDAMNLLKNQRSSEAYYLRGLIAIERSNWTDTKQAFRMVTDPKRKFDIQVDNSKRYWMVRNLKGIKRSLHELNTDNPRYTEGRYYLGLAHYHSGEIDLALRIWEQAAKNNPNDPWSLRIDWTYGLAKLGPDQMVTPLERAPSVLGRKYLSPNGNPDLESEL